MRKLFCTILLTSLPLQYSHAVIEFKFDFNNLCEKLLNGESGTSELMQGFVRLQWPIEELIKDAEGASAEVIEAGLEAAENYVELALIYHAESRTRFLSKSIQNMDDSEAMTDRYEKVALAYHKMAIKLLRLLRDQQYDKARDQYGIMRQFYTQAHKDYI